MDDKVRVLASFFAHTDSDSHCSSCQSKPVCSALPPHVQSVACQFSCLMIWSPLLKHTGAHPPRVTSAATVWSQSQARNTDVCVAAQWLGVSPSPQLRTGNQPVSIDFNRFLGLAPRTLLAQMATAVCPLNRSPTGQAYMSIQSLMDARPTPDAA